MTPDPDDPRVEEAFDEWRAEASAAAAAATAKAYEESWQIALGEVGEDERSFREGELLGHQQNHINQVRGIDEETRLAIRASLEESLREGEGVEDAAQRLSRVFDAPEHRLRSIARTELNRSSNAARADVFDSSPFVEGVENIATMDARVRESHAAADGEVRPRNGVFTRGAAAGHRHPTYGVNCRCGIAARTALSRAAFQESAAEEEIPGQERRVKRLQSEYIESWHRLKNQVLAL